MKLLYQHYISWNYNIYFQGYDTTSSAISFALFLVGHHPEIQVGLKRQHIHNTVLNIFYNVPDCNVGKNPGRARWNLWRFWPSSYDGRSTKNEIFRMLYKRIAAYISQRAFHWKIRNWRHHYQFSSLKCNQIILHIYILITKMSFQVCT